MGFRKDGQKERVFTGGAFGPAIAGSRMPRLYPRSAATFMLLRFAIAVGIVGGLLLHAVR